MSLRDLTARSSQAKSDISAEALEKGRAIYRKIVDEGDQAELSKFKRLAAASVKMQRPVEIKKRDAQSPGLVGRLAAAVTTIFGR